MTIKMLICLFVYGFFNHCWTPTGSFPESFVQIKLDLAEIFRMKNVYLFVCLWICLFYVLIIVGHPQEHLLSVFEDLN